MADTFARMRQLIGSTSEWASHDIVLGDGEIGIERTASAGEVLFKVGNGVLKWSQLPYYPDQQAIMATIRQEFTSADDAMKSLLQTQIQQGDSVTQAAITAEVTARTTGDSALGTRIDNLTATVTTNNTQLGARITTEEQARAAGDLALAQRATALEAKATVSAVRQGDGLVEFFDTYLDEADTENAVNYLYGLTPGNTSVVSTPDGGGKAFTINGEVLGKAIRSKARIPVTSERAYRITFDVQATGGAVRAAFGASAYDKDGAWKQATSTGREHWAASDDTTIAAGERRRITGYLSGFAPENSSGMGESHPAFENPHRWVDGTSSAGWAVYLVSVPAGASLVINAVEIVEVTDINTARVALGARITTEEQARVAGDTALATRTSTVEARIMADTDLSWNGNAYGTSANVDRDWNLHPSRADWKVTADGNAGGGKSLDTLATPPVEKFALYRKKLPYYPEKVYEVSCTIYNPEATDTVLYAGFMSFDALDKQLLGEGGTHTYCIAKAEVIPATSIRTFTSYISGRVAVAPGSGAGMPGGTLQNPKPMPNDTVGISPFIYLTQAANRVIRIINFYVKEVTQAHSLNAAITLEQTARTNADNALAQQIQQITAGSYTGAKTYRQDAQPTAPGVGDIWLKPVAGKSDEMRRYSGSAWELIPLAEAPDLTAINARITAEETARASADAAQAQRITSVESNVTAVNNKADANASGLVQANAKITTEEQTRTTQFQQLAARTTGVETSVNGLSASVTQQQTSINGILAKYHVRVDANGRVAGIELLNGTGGSEFNVLVDAFRIFNPSTGQNEPIFEARDGGVFIKQAYVGSIQVDGVTIDTNAQGALTIKQHGVTTNLLAQNAAVRPYTFFTQGSWIIPTKNAWLTAQVGGQAAQISVRNPGDGGGFFELVVVFLAGNGGSDSDTMGFRVKRSDGVYLPQQYINVHMDGRGSANQPSTFHFFDEGVPAGAQLTYTLEVMSNDSTPVRSITMLGKMFKNASSLPNARM